MKPETYSPLIELEDLTKHFSPQRSGLFSRSDVVRAVDGVSLSIPLGKTLALVGESGSGKSTIANLLLGLEVPTSGVIRAKGEVIFGAGMRRSRLKEVRKWMQPVLQDPTDSLNHRMRVGSIIAEPLVLNQPDVTPNRVKERVEVVLSEVGLAHQVTQRYPHQLSGGQKQRVAIARALVVEPTMLVLDEPVSALDVSTSAQVLNLLSDLKASRGMTYLLVAHNLATVSNVADHVAVMYCGRIVESAPAGELFSEPRHPYTQALFRAARPELREEVPSVSGGEPASPVSPPSGCRFHPRCPFAMAECSIIEPILQPAGAERKVSCHLY